MIEIHIISTILVLETQYFSCCLLHFSNSYLSIYLKTKQKNSKTNKQTRHNKKEKKKEEGEKKVFSRIWTRYLRFDPTSHSHYAIGDGHLIWRKVSHLMPFPWNFRGQTTGANDRAIKTKQWDEIRANWNQATDSKKQCKRISWQWNYICDTKPTQLLREVGRKTLAYVFLSRFPLLF